MARLEVVHEQQGSGGLERRGQLGVLACVGRAGHDPHGTGQPPALFDPVRGVYVSANGGTAELLETLALRQPLHRDARHSGARRAWGRAGCGLVRRLAPPVETPRSQRHPYATQARTGVHRARGEAGRRTLREALKYGMLDCRTPCHLPHPPSCLVRLSANTLDCPVSE